MLARGVMTFEGVVAMLDPDINIIQILANHLDNKTFDQVEFKKKGKEFLRSAYLANDNLLDVPRYLVDTLKMMLRGQSKVNLEVLGSDEPLNRVEQMVNRLIVAIIAAALLLGSSFISTTSMTPTLLGIPALGFLGYLAAMILGICMVFDILYHKWKNNHQRRH